MEDPRMKYCPRCGAANSADDMFCGNCGTRLEEMQQAAQPQQNAYAQPAGMAQYRPASGVDTKTMNIMLTIHGALLAFYGLSAILLYKKMGQYDFDLYGSGSTPVHLFFLLTMIFGIFLIVFGLVKNKGNKDHFKSMDFIIPVVILILCLIFSQANRVATAQFSFGDLAAIDKFTDSGATVIKYLFVTAMGITGAVIPWVKKR